jgi:hypothetical protein
MAKTEDKMTELVVSVVEEAVGVTVSLVMILQLSPSTQAPEASTPPILMASKTASTTDGTPFSSALEAM